MNRVLLPGGELVVPSEVTLERLADAFDEVNEAIGELATIKREMQDEVIRRLDYEGRRQITIDGFQLQATAPTEKEWDLAELQLVLAELVNEETISGEKAERCIKWEPKPVWSEIKTLLSDPRCAARVGHTFKEVPANRYAKVKRV